MEEIEKLVRHARVTFNESDINYKIQRGDLLDKFILRFTMWFGSTKIMNEEYEFDYLTNNERAEEFLFERIKEKLMLAGFMKFKEISKNNYE